MAKDEEDGESNVEMDADEGAGFFFGEGGEDEMIELAEGGGEDEASEPAAADAVQQDE